MSETVSQATGTTPSKRAAPGAREADRSMRRLSGLVNEPQPILSPSESSSPQLTRPVSGLRQSPISAKFVTLIAEQIGTGTSMTDAERAEEEAELTRVENRLEKQRIRGEANRATTRARQNESKDGAAPSQTPIVSREMSHRENSREEWLKDRAEFDKQTQFRDDEIEGLASDAKDCSKGLEWAEKGDDSQFIGSTFN
jgi:hypothetical protein